MKGEKMKNATRIFCSTLGTIMALGGIEHGIGEIFQGNIEPTGIMIQSWPNAEFFRNVSGEPAMTVIPNILLTGILAVLVSLAMLVWTVLFVHRKNGGLITVLLSIAMLLLGGGIFPPILLIIIGVVAIGIRSPLNWWRTHLSVGFRNFLKKLWLWSYTACIIAWLSALLGPGMLGYFFGMSNPALILVIIFLALGFLLLTIFTGFAYDTHIQVGSSSGTSEKEKTAWTNLPAAIR
jgi:hypothetical protein